MKKAIYFYPCKHCDKLCKLKSEPRKGKIFSCNSCNLKTLIGKFYLRSGEMVLTYEPGDDGRSDR